MGPCPLLLAGLADLGGTEVTLLLVIWLIWLDMLLRLGLPRLPMWFIMPGEGDPAPCGPIMRGELVIPRPGFGPAK